MRKLTKAVAGLAFVAATVAVAGCSTADDATATSTPPVITAEHERAAETMLARHGLEGASPTEVVESLDRLAKARPLDLIVSVRPQYALMVDAEGVEVPIAMPEDLFYLSVAPFVENTHPCFNHNLGTCTGELANSDIHVKIVDSDGKVLVDEDTTTYFNGFKGFWLPRDIEGTVTITYGEKSGTVDFGTSDDDATCVTTLQVA